MLLEAKRDAWNVGEASTVCPFLVIFHDVSSGCRSALTSTVRHPLEGAGLSSRGEPTGGPGAGAGAGAVDFAGTRKVWVLFRAKVRLRLLLYRISPSRPYR